MSDDPRHQLGQSAEDLAADYLETAGYEIIERNFRLRLGEIDIIAKDSDTLVFVEVRSRKNSWKVHPAATVNHRKQQQIIRCAMAYCQNKKIKDTMIRFDVVAVLTDRGEIELFQNAFEAGR